MNTDKDMDERKEEHKTVAPVRRFSLEGISLLIAALLSILGIGITDYSPLQSYRYWLVMTLILAISSMIIGHAKAHRTGLSTAKNLITQLIHWIATAIAVAGIFLLLKAGRLNYESAGLVLLVILGLSTFLDGYRINWHFSLLGILIFIASLIAAYIEEYLWMLLIISVAIVAIILLWEQYKHKKRVTLKSP